MRVVLAVLLVAFVSGSAVLAGPANLFEWLGVGEFVVAAKHIGSNGKLQEFVVDSSLRGEIPEGTLLRVNLRRANRNRNRAIDPKSKKLDLDRSYLLLLEEEPIRKPGAPSRYALVRGLRGIRELPSEGSQAYLAAARRFVEIHDRKDDRVTWRGLEAMLEETNPLLIETALDQYLKFRRGGSDIQGALEPLLDHPKAGIRQRTARLLGQIVEQHGATWPAEAARARQGLIARARRDTSIEVRVAATRALDAFHGQDIDELLRAIAEDDPDQAVRYAAERLLYERSRRREAEETGQPRAVTDNSPGSAGTSD